jgi:hypothetical protein
MRAAHAILFLLVVTACSDDDGPCATDACKATEAKYRLGTIRDTAEHTFVAEDGAYTLVRFEYGNTLACDELDDEDCSYSTYCAFVVDGVDYPLFADFVNEEDELFNLDDYCTDLGCDMPADDLAIFDDEAFEDWLWEADDETDVLASCF